MIHHQNYRQQIDIFRKELAEIIKTPYAPKDPRLIIDKKGYQSRSITSKSDEQRMTIYGYERLESVARVYGVFQFLSRLEGLPSKAKPTIPSAAGAVWQAFRGTQDSNACHTCPTHLQLNGHLPTMLTSNAGLQRYIILEFANCILMPRSINEIDKIFDDRAGKSSFEKGAKVILNEAGATWQQALQIFREGVREFLGPAHDVLFDPSRGTFCADDGKDQVKIDMFSAYYEGMYLSPLNVSSIDSMMKQVENEIGRQVTS